MDEGKLNTASGQETEPAAKKTAEAEKVERGETPAAPRRKRRKAAVPAAAAEETDAAKAPATPPKERETTEKVGLPEKKTRTYSGKKANTTRRKKVVPAQTPAAQTSAEAARPDAEKTPKEEPAPVLPEKPEPPEIAEAPRPADKQELPETPQKPEIPEKAEPAEKPATAENAAMADGEAQTAPDPEEEKRAAELTRTVRLSIEQIMRQAAEQAEQTPEQEEKPQAEPEPVAQEETAPPTFLIRIRDRLAEGTFGLLKWLLLVLALVLLVAGLGVAWLYKNATPDMLPQIEVSFDGQELEPTSYKWAVPVISEKLKRTYADTNSATPIELGTIDCTAPAIEINTTKYTAALEIEDADKNKVFSGDLLAYKNFAFEENGNYVAKLILANDGTSYSTNAEVTGSQTYQFAFEVLLRPSVQLNSTSVTQGSVVAVRVTGLSPEDAPRLDTDFENAGFVPNGSKYVAYLAIPYDCETKEYPVKVHTENYDETVTLEVRARNWGYRDYSRQGQLTSPYLAEADVPQAVQSLLGTSDQKIYWAATGFVQPFISSITITLPFGTTEYVGRSVKERGLNQGTGRTNTNVLVTGRYGESLISPADGRIALAQDLGGAAGNTIVIDHGAGIKSVFYNLDSISVKQGSVVVKGQSIAVTKQITIGEVRVGKVAVEPMSIWRNQSDGIRFF